MLFFADVSIFAQPPFKTCRSHLHDIHVFSSAVFWLHFGTFKGPNGFLSVSGSNIRAKKHQN